jgi:glycosyltransferase involved in cell wall biosynthesis
LEKLSASNLSLGVLKDYKKKTLTVRILIPTLNEEKNLKVILSELKDLGYFDVLVIDGKSIDKTIEVAMLGGANAVVQNGRGKGAAVRQALTKYCKDVDAVIMMDADGSMNPNEIPRFIKSLDSGADVVKGSRFRNGGYTYDMTLLRRIGNTIFTTIFNFLYTARHTDLCYGYIGFSKHAIEIIGPRLKANGFEIETELLIEAEKAGLKVAEVPSTEFLRRNGNSNLRTFKDGKRILKTLFKGITKRNS